MLNGYHRRHPLVRYPFFRHVPCRLLWLADQLLDCVLSPTVAVSLCRLRRRRFCARRAPGKQRTGRLIQTVALSSPARCSPATCNSSRFATASIHCTPHKTFTHKAKRSVMNEFSCRRRRRNKTARAAHSRIKLMLISHKAPLSPCSLGRCCCCRCCSCFCYQ